MFPDISRFIQNLGLSFCQMVCYNYTHDGMRAYQNEHNFCHSGFTAVLEVIDL